MKKIGILMAVITIFSFFSVTKSFAQQEMQWRGGGGWGIGSPYGRMYDLKTVETITGEVVSVDTITPMKGMGYGVHLMVKTDEEKISVHLGPGWYIENQDTKIEPKDKVEITGSRITLEGKPAIIAAEVKKGEEVLKLRDEKGFPLWSGWRKR
ncbi:MAG: DNA-binding protein [Candidatus Jettenia sp.]|nr:DNA-binding protein [Candidatus Jettenia sp.]